MAWNRTKATDLERRLTYLMQGLPDVKGIQPSSNEKDNLYAINFTFVKKDEKSKKIEKLPCTLQYFDVTDQLISWSHTNQMDFPQEVIDHISKKYLRSYHLEDSITYYEYHFWDVPIMNLPNE